MSVTNTSTELSLRGNAVASQQKTSALPPVLVQQHVHTISHTKSTTTEQIIHDSEHDVQIYSCC